MANTTDAQTVGNQFDDEYVRDIPHGPTKVDIHKECGRHVRREDSRTGGFIYTCIECDECWSSKGLAYYVINTHRISDP